MKLQQRYQKKTVGLTNWIKYYEIYINNNFINIFLKPLQTTNDLLVIENTVNIKLNGNTK